MSRCYHDCCVHSFCMHTIVQQLQLNLPAPHQRTITNILKVKNLRFKQFAINFLAKRTKGLTLTLFLPWVYLYILCINMCVCVCTHNDHIIMYTCTLWVHDVLVVCVHTHLLHCCAINVYCRSCIVCVS